MVLLMRAANDQLGCHRARVAQGGPGPSAAGHRARRRKPASSIRTACRCRNGSSLRDDRARGVVLDDGSEIEARASCRRVDPKHTFLQLCDPIDLAPEFLWRMRNYRTHGTVAKINLALSALPTFHGRFARTRWRARPHRAGRRLSRARV